MGGIRIQRRWSFGILTLIGILAGTTAWMRSPTVTEIVEEINPPGLTDSTIDAKTFQGSFEFKNESIIFRLGGLSFEMGLNPPYLGRFFVDHATFMGMPMVVSIDLEGVGSPFKGTFQTTQFLMDYRPGPLFSGKYEVKDNTLFLSDCEVGEIYQFQGEIGLTVPYPVSLKISMNQTPVSEIIFMSGLAQSDSLTGEAKGEWHVRGPIANLKATGTLEFTNGRLGQKYPVFFHSLFFHLEGVLPLLMITSARLNGEQGVFLAKGEIDLTRLWEGNPLEKVKFYSESKTMRWKGWDIQTTDENSTESELSVGRNLNQEMRVSFKSFMNDEIEMARTRENHNEFEFEYRFQKDKRVKWKLKGHEEFVGLENRVKF